MSLRRRVVALASLAGYELHRHPAHRRVQMLSQHAVDLILDVGAATGGYATELRRHGYDGRILSFEPLTNAFALLQRKAQRDPTWQVLNVALGEEVGNAVINVAGNGDSSSLLPMLSRHATAAAQAAYVGIESVQVRTLDDVFAENEPKASRPFLKLDVQGYERHVLAGAQESLDRMVGVQLELSLVPLYAGGMLYDEALSLMREAGFRLCGIEPGFADPNSGDLLQADGIFFRSR